MSKFEKSRGLYLKQHYYFWLLRGKETKSLYMRFQHFIYNHVETFCFETRRKCVFWTFLESM